MSDRLDLSSALSNTINSFVSFHSFKATLGNNKRIIDKTDAKLKMVQQKFKMKAATTMNAPTVWPVMPELSRSSSIMKSSRISIPLVVNSGELSKKHS